MNEGYKKNLFNKAATLTLSLDSNNKNQFESTSERIDDFLNLSIGNK